MVRLPALCLTLANTFKRVGVRRFNKNAVALTGAIAMLGLSSPAMAASEPSTRLVSCGEQSCLLVSGHREDPDSIVSINGQVVSVEGERGWRVRVPVETVREWSAPFARTIEVSLRNPETQAEAVASVALPIGMLGGTTDLATLVISAR